MSWGRPSSVSWHRWTPGRWYWPRRPRAGCGYWATAATPRPWCANCTARPCTPTPPPHGRCGDGRCSSPARPPFRPDRAKAPRGFVQERLSDWGLAHMSTDLVLITSELVTNALIHAGSDVDVRLRVSGDRVRLEVRDFGSDPPVPTAYSPTDEGSTQAENGRGEFLLSSGEADLEALDLAEPALVFRLGDAGDQVVADVGEPCPLAGKGRRSEHLTQACSWTQGDPKARAQVPMDTAAPAATGGRLGA
ncbi:ATP-binding protein [Streptomyces sp. Ncost-T10-10d]|uniref:ATP-binding protein n=1 Tax=Streptomyces sp. Ncost-T10-10d TaxID=1839774 RepID=UPI00351F9C43